MVVWVEPHLHLADNHSAGSDGVVFPLTLRIAVAIWGFAFMRFFGSENLAGRSSLLGVFVSEFSYSSSIIFIDVLVRIEWKFVGWRHLKRALASLFASWSAFLFPGMPMWLLVQMN